MRLPLANGATHLPAAFSPNDEANDVSVVPSEFRMAMRFGMLM